MTQIYESVREGKGMFRLMRTLRRAWAIRAAIREHNRYALEYRNRAAEIDPLRVATHRGWHMTQGDWIER